MIGYILSAISLCYIIYIYSLLITREEETYKDSCKPVSVIVPCYNEKPDALKGCIKSIHLAGGEKQIILVDNNSNPETKAVIKQIKSWYPEVLVLCETKQGKRFAHAKGLGYAIHDIIVFVDSDTILEENALIEITKPFSNERIGAVAGQIKVFNKDKNIITKSFSAMFWTSNNIFRRATSSLGMMQVIAGALSAYRKDLLLKLEKDYLTQTFLGKPCAISDDRYLTMRIQTRLNKKIAYQDSAVGFTYMPENITKSWKMLERWKRGVLRETILLWKEPKKNAKLLFFDVQYNVFMNLISIALKTWLIIHTILYPSVYNVITTILWFVIISTLYSSLMIVENIKEYPYKLVWSMMYEFFFAYATIHALINIRHQSNWSTR